MASVRQLSLTFQWVYIMSALFSFLFFTFQYFKKRCKWEVLYVSSCGGIIAFLKLYLENETVNAFTIGENGRKMPWLRYVGWLVTCPVLLIHLGNLTGEANFNIMRLMKMLVGLQMMVVSASTATVIDSPVRWFFYMTGWFAMLLVFSQAFDVFYEAQNIFPKKAKKHVAIMAFTFFSSWCGFAFVWFLSPHGIGAISTDFTNFLMAICDVPSKTIWGLLGWYLRWNILRKADGTLNEKTAKALEVQIKAKVCIVDNDMTMAHYLLGKLTSMDYEPVIASNPDELYAIIEAGEVDVIFMEYGVAEAGDHNLPRDIFYNYRLPVVAYGYEIPVNTFFLRSKHITDAIHGLPGDEDIDAVIERWAPVPGMEEETYASRRPIKGGAAAADAAAAAPVVIRAPSFTEKASMIFGASANPHAAPAAAAPAPAPAPNSGSRSPRGGRASPRASGRMSPRGSVNAGGPGGGFQQSGNVSPRSGSVAGGFNARGSNDMMFNSMEGGQQARGSQGPGGGFGSNAAPPQQQGFNSGMQQQQQQQQQMHMQPQQQMHKQPQPQQQQQMYMQPQQQMYMQPQPQQQMYVQPQQQMQSPVQTQEVRVQMEAAPPAPAAAPVQGEGSSGSGLHKLQSKIQDVELQLIHLRALSSTQNKAHGQP